MMKSQIASDLHDEIGSNLSSISLLAQSVKKHATLSLKDEERLATVYRIASNSAVAMREIIWFINPENDKTERFVEKMKQTARAMLDTIPYTCNITGNLKSLELEIKHKRNIYLFFKESLQNIVKHSEATHVSIHFHSENNHYALSVCDNGRGFNTEILSEGNGLRNFQKRATELSAHYTIRSEVGAGTKILLKYCDIGIEKKDESCMLKNTRNGNYE
mgnify:FL=1